MKKVYIEDIGEYEGKEVTISGWLYNKRSSGKLYFILVRDGTGLIQCVVSQADVPEEVFKTAEEVTQESSLMVTGVISAGISICWGQCLTHLPQATHWLARPGFLSWSPPH